MQVAGCCSSLPTACLPVCWPGYSAQQTLPTDCLPACVLAKAIVSPGYSAQATAHPSTCRACLFACPGYSAKATEHPASCLPVCLLERLLCSRLLNTLPPACLPVLLARLLCPGYCTPCRAACLPLCWPGYSAQANPAHPDRLPACLLARLLCPGYCTPRYLPIRSPGCSAQATEHRAGLPGCFAGQATLPRLLHTLPPACLPVCWPGYSAQATAHPATCLPFCLLGAQATLR